MHESTLGQNLETATFGRNLFYYDLTDSTNVRAEKSLESENLPEGTVFIASKQTAGKGTGNNSWESSAPLGLWLSIIVHEPYRMDPISLVPGVALAKLLRERYRIEAHLKWPNDVLVGHKKISGILCKTKKQPDGTGVCIVGIGINVNQDSFAGSLKEIAISMALAGGQEFILEEVFQNYMLEFEKLYYSGKSIINEWKRYSKMIGRVIEIRAGDEIKRAEVTDMTPEGYLLLKYPDGSTDILASRTNIDVSPGY